MEILILGFSAAMLLHGFWEYRRRHVLRGLVMGVPAVAVITILLIGNWS
jgi:hypothetical protein